MRRGWYSGLVHRSLSGQYGWKVLDRRRRGAAAAPAGPAAIDWTWRARLHYANLHDDLGFEVARRVELGEDAATVFDTIYHPRFVKGRVKLQFYTVGGDAPRFCGSEDLLRGVLRRTAILHGILRARGDYRLIETVADLDALPELGGGGLALTIEGAAPLGYDLNFLPLLYRLGLRSICLMWFRANQVGDGVGEARNGGLTTFGRDLVAEMERVGVIVDLAQASPHTVDDVLGVATRPVVASHANAAGAYRHVRNLADEHIRGIAATGGIVGLTSYPAHLAEDRASLEHFLSQVDYVVNLVGHEHVALGLNIIAGSFEEETRFFQRSQIEYARLWLEELEDIDRLPAIEGRLRDRGYDEEAVRAIMGGNIERVLRSVLPTGPHGDEPR
jgi:membrane dipeptidase